MNLGARQKSPTFQVALEMPIDLGVTVATIKAIAGVAKAAGRIDLYNDIIGLQQAVLELIADNTTAIQENAKLARRNVELLERVGSLEKELATRAAVVFRNEAYWQSREDQPADGPFCPKCYDGQGKLSRMTYRNNGFTCCVVCNHCYGRALPIEIVRG